jgi:hypothetical protein
MGKFLENEKIRYTALMPHTQIFNEKAKTPGLYKDKLRQFCLPQVCSDENLFDGIRESAKKYFRKYEIKWHDLIIGEPSMIKSGGGESSRQVLCL